MRNKNIKWLLSLSKGFRWHIFIATLIGIFRVCFALFFVWVSKTLIDIASNSIHGNIYFFIGLLIIAMIGNSILSAWGNYIENLNGIKLKNKLRKDFFSHVMQSLWFGKERFHSADIVNRLDEDINTVSSAYCKTIPSTIVTCFQLVAALVFLATLSLQLALLLLLILPFFLIASKLFIKKLRQLTKFVRESESKVQEHVQEKLQHKILIQTLEQTRQMSDKLIVLQNILEGNFMRRANFTLLSKTLAMTGFSAGYLIAFIWGVRGIHTGAITFGTMTAFLQLVGQIQRPMSDLTGAIPSIVHALAGADRLKELSVLPQEEEGEPHFLEGQLGIAITNLNFGYSDTNKLVIKNFSFDFKPGSRTAILGETGAGKSTLIRLMMDLLHPISGNINIYNQEESIQVSSHTRCNMAYVPQGNTLLSGTIRENLLLANPQVCDSDIRKALNIAVAEFVYDLPDGLETLCGERGTGLSEGQAQRIGIARGLLRPSKILLLDEFSSSLDKKTERLLMERLISQAKDKTLIFITHREMITEYCDSTIFL